MRDGLMKYKYVLWCFILVGFTYSCGLSDKQISFTEEEQLWINEHQQIVLAVDNSYAPLNYLDKEGKLTGLNIELVRLIEKRIGVKIRLEGSNWNEALQKAMNHEVDGLINASPLAERKAKLNFSNSFFKDPLALVTYKDNDIQDFENVQFQRIAAKQGSQHLKVLESKIPKHLTIPIKTLNEGIQLLSSKQIDGIYDDLAPLYHILSSEGYSHLKIAFIEPSENGARIAIRNNAPILLSILNKAIESITSEERILIQNKWLSFTPERDYKVFYLAIAILISFVLLISLWTWALKTMVNKRTNELKKELQRRKETEKLLIEAKEKAEESDRLKSAFLANISHEIRTPMNGIVGFSELLLVGSFTLEEQNKYHELVLNNSKQLLSIINDLVNISKLEAKLVEVVKSKIDISKMFEGLQSVFNLRVKGTNIELSYANGLDANKEIFLDEVKLKQVLTNLISNAIKNTENGYVRFGVCELADKKLKFTVEDSGLGIKPENHKNIFNRFWKVKSGANEGGTGLGLAISKAHVELMGGEIWVESEINQGAKFYFTIPF
ncbi:ATP-binding protein [Labilibacter marinus]|uniref:ATP-binding protein n=1 Tax=Labilibacter marinus TaxID=1477105 RepID=UPI00094FCBB2|nr:transporter substrate-binding domain-containing protein [Labilibacter marinus]